MAIIIKGEQENPRITGDKEIDIEIYIHKIWELEKEYIDNILNDSADIKKKQPFAGMIKYISKNMQKPYMGDICLLDKIWDIYTALCYKYNHIVTIERYCILININRDTFYSWFKGETQNDYCEKLGCKRSDVVKKWDRESESSWQDEASTGNPGSMFVLKARRGWNENAPAVGAAEQAMIGRTKEEISRDYIESDGNNLQIEVDF